MEGKFEGGLAETALPVIENFKEIAGRDLGKGVDRLRTGRRYAELSFLVGPEQEDEEARRNAGCVTHGG